MNSWKKPYIMQRLVRIFLPLHGRGFTDTVSGPEKTQVGDDEADLEKLQELLVRAAFVVGKTVLRSLR
jgi:hypothetical protein